jgi:regulator of RNase E activity RraA
MLTGINIPVRIGGVTVMPGDIVFGDREGVTFIPPHLAEKIADSAEASRLHDEFTQLKIKEGKYKIRDVYPLNKELQKEFEEWKKKKQAP